MGSSILLVRYLLRNFRKAPLFPVAAICTLAIGIGCNTAMYSVIHGVLLEPLPYEESEQLFHLTCRLGDRDIHYFTEPDFMDIRERMQSFEVLSAYYDYKQVGFDLTGADQPRRIEAMPVSANYLRAIYMDPIAGRHFTAEDEQSENRAIIISYRLWQDQFNGNRAAIGESLLLDGLPWTVVGVLPPDYQEPFGRPIDVWTPYALRWENKGRDNFYLSALARVRKGVSAETVRAELNTVVGTINKEFTDRDPLSVVVIPLDESVIGGIDTILLVLFAAVALVLLAACVNLANLSLARCSTRERELAIRSAFGAGRGHLIRIIVIENLILAAIGGVIGFMLASWGTDLLLALRPDALPRIEMVTFDFPVLIFTLGLSLLTGILFSFLPAIQYSRPDIERRLREIGRSASAGRRHRYLNNSLVVIQVGFTLVLLISATLLVQSLIRLRGVNLGIAPEKVLTFQLNLPQIRYPLNEPDRRIAFYHELDTRLESLPGVRAAGATTRLPVTGEYHDWGYAVRRELERTGETVWHPANHRFIGGDFFHALGIDLLRGRLFREEDTVGTPPVVIVNKTLVDRHFGDCDPIGETVWRNGWREIIGVVEDVRVGFRDEVPDKLYLPLNQFADYSPWVLTHVISGTGVTDELIPAIRHELAAIDPELIPFSIQPMSQVVNRALVRERFVTALMIGFTGVTMILALIGLYSMLAYSVRRRLREIGIRFALGATTRQVRLSVFGDGMRLVLGGVLLGVILSMFLTRWLGSLVYGVEVTEPATFLLATLVMLLTASIAILAPARRAARTDPVRILNNE